MKTVNCEEIRALLEGAELSVERATVAEHLRGCGACAQYAAQHESENGLLAKGLALPADEEGWRRIKAELAARLDREAMRAGRRRRMSWFAASAAAAMLLTLGGVALVKTSRTDGDNELAAGVARLQEKVREQQVLDDIEQLQIAFQEAGDEDAASAAEDAELYVERILALDGSHGEQSAEILEGIERAGIRQRLRQVRQSVGNDAPRPVLASLDLAAATLDEARAALPRSTPRAASAADAFADAEAKYQSGEYEAALASYRAFADRHPDDWRAGQARYTSAFILQKKLRRLDQAREDYERVVARDASSPLASAAQFRIAQASEQSGDTQKAMREYEKFVKRAARHAREPGARKKLEFLDRKSKGQPAEPPGWAGEVGRKRWRKNLPPSETPEKRPRNKGAANVEKAVLPKTALRP